MPIPPSTKAPVILPLRFPEPEWDVYADDKTARTDYTIEEHGRWRARYNVLSPLWSQYAPGEFLDGLINLSLDPSRIPRLVDINKLLNRHSGYRAFGLDAPLPMASHLAAVAHSRAPVARGCPLSRPTSLAIPEATDVIHDLACCLPWLSTPQYIVAWRTLGRIGLGIKARVPKRPNKRELGRLHSAAGALKRVWVAAFLKSLVLEDGAVKALGTHILADRDLLPKIPSLTIQRFDLNTVIHSSEPLYYQFNSLDHLATELLDLEKWLAAGRLDFLPGAEAGLSEEDKQSFLVSLGF